MIDHSDHFIDNNLSLAAATSEYRSTEDFTWLKRGEYVKREARIRWLSPSEILQILTNYEKMGFEQGLQPPIQVINGNLYLFDRARIPNFRDDGIDWVRKKSPDRIREDFHRILINGEHVVTGLYTYASTNANCRRRCYRLPAGSTLFLVHYRTFLKVRKDAASSAKRKEMEASPDAVSALCKIGQSSEQFLDMEEDWNAVGNDSNYVNVLMQHTSYQYSCDPSIHIDSKRGTSGDVFVASSSSSLSLSELLDDTANMPTANGISNSTDSSSSDDNSSALDSSHSFTSKAMVVDTTSTNSTASAGDCTIKEELQTEDGGDSTLALPQPSILHLTETVAVDNVLAAPPLTLTGKDSSTSTSTTPWEKLSLKRKVDHPEQTNVAATTKGSDSSAAASKHTSSSGTSRPYCFTNSSHHLSLPATRLPVGSNSSPSSGHYGGNTGLFAKPQLQPMIVDFNPASSYTEGGMNILIVVYPTLDLSLIPWNVSLQVIFGWETVDAMVVAPACIRCVTPKLPIGRYSLIIKTTQGQILAGPSALTFEYVIDPAGLDGRPSAAQTGGATAKNSTSTTTTISSRDLSTKALDVLAQVACASKI